MISGIDISLDLKERVRVAYMRLKSLWHLISALEQGRIYLGISSGYRIFLIYYIEIHVSVICVHHYLYGVPYIVGTPLIVKRLRIRVVGTLRVGVYHPVQFAVYSDHIRIVFI